MLDPEAPDERRDQIASEARKRIESSGSLKADSAWGMRKLAYEIRQRTEADYRFFRFETESPLLDELDHNLKITDGVLRFRIFKVDPESPVIEPPPPVSLASSAPSRGPGGRRGPGRGRDDYEDRGHDQAARRRRRRTRRRRGAPAEAAPAAGRRRPSPRRSRPRPPSPRRPPPEAAPAAPAPRPSRRPSKAAASAFAGPRGARTRRSPCLDWGPIKRFRERADFSGS